MGLVVSYLIFLGGCAAAFFLFGCIIAFFDWLIEKLENIP